MRTATKASVLCVAFAMMLLSVPALNAQQRPKDAPAAPVPSQIGAAKRVFISYNGGVNGLIAKDDRVYDNLYAAMKSWGQFELVGAPADADLVLEASLPSIGLRVAILDPKTHFVLWVLAERLDTRGGFHPYWDYDKTMSKIVEDFKSLNDRAKAPAEGTQK